ncbi:MAG: hypothetical protein CL790_06810 [Chloroflexi bacterium]|nr:hypothetical protein [Chloroflexota bacterium]HCU73966.1 hypothetical protein [Chloroflexota bacterium]
MVGSSQPEAQRDYAKTLKKYYPDFIPTQALYLDFEGGGKGNEVILSVFWPQRRGSERFHWVRRQDASRYLERTQWSEIEDFISYRNDWLQSVVVFSGQTDAQPGEPDEQRRLREWLGHDPFSSIEWVNLHRPLMARGGAGLAKEYIRTHRLVQKPAGDGGFRSKNYSLENLEFLFAVDRAKDLRSRGDLYSDGSRGTFGVLTIEAQVVRGKAEDGDQDRLKRYCRQDVESMFEIARRCKKYW